MSRKDFISDNLVDMRERLKRNYEEMNAAANAVVPETAAATRQLQESPVLPPPAPRSADPGERERLKRDLEGRMRRDYAAVVRLTELAAERDRELERFREMLENALPELEKLDRDAAEIKALDALRLRYFQAQGRWEAANAVTPGTAAVPEESRTLLRVWLESLPVAAAIVAAALLIVGAMAWFFC